MSHRGHYVSGAFYLGGVMTGYHNKDKRSNIIMSNL